MVTTVEFAQIIAAAPTRALVGLTSSDAARRMDARLEVAEHFLSRLHESSTQAHRSQLALPLA